MSEKTLARRQFLRQIAAAATIPVVHALTARSTESPLPPVRAITRGPAFHWFSYYDKLQFDPAGRRALGMEVDFEHRSPRPGDAIRVGMVDLDAEDRWTQLGQSRAWCWQQGCMLQWRPGSEDEILWNDRGQDGYISHILNVKTGRQRTLGHPFYTVSPDGRTAVAPDFRRVQDMRPGYGYPGLLDPYADKAAPAESGIFRLDLQTDRQELIISLADVVATGKIPGDPKDAKHWFNHLLFNTDGSRFVFLHRWAVPGVSGRGTRMLTAKPDGTDIHIVDDYGRTSHFIWRDPRHILAWAWRPSHQGAFYLFTDGTDQVEAVGKSVMTGDGHCSYLPGNQWIVCDTYPDSRRCQNVYLYHVETGRRVALGSFPIPKEYTGEWRCDTHPRFRPDGRTVCIDSCHEGNGRQMYLIDIGSFT